MKLLRRISALEAIGIRNAKAYSIKGKQTASSLSEISTACQSLGVKKGEIWRGGDGRIRFSREFKPEHHQRFRNVLQSL